jgi:hypothetical protein
MTINFVRFLSKPIYEGYWMSKGSILKKILNDLNKVIYYMLFGGL